MSKIGGGEMEKVELDYFDARFNEVKTMIGHSNNIVERHIKENEKDHNRYESELVDFSQIIQRDRSETNNKFDRLMEAVNQLTALSANVAELRKGAENTRENIQILFERVRTGESDINKMAEAIRGEIHRETSEVMRELDTKIEQVSSRTLKNEVALAGVRDTSTFVEKEDYKKTAEKVEHLEDIVAQGIGGKAVINWIITAGIGVVSILIAIFSGV